MKTLAEEFMYHLSHKGRPLGYHWQSPDEVLSGFVRQYGTEIYEALKQWEAEQAAKAARPKRPSDPMALYLMGSCTEIHCALCRTPPGWRLQSDCREKRHTGIPTSPLPEGYK